jgi:Tol biopolymer transport system component
MLGRFRPLVPVAALAVAAVAGSCGVPPAPTPTARPSVPPSSLIPSPLATAPSISPEPSRRQLNGILPVLVGEPIDLRSLRGRIVFDDFEDVFTMNADGSGYRVLAGAAGPEFDGAWSPDGASIVYRDSRRGINEDDEIAIVAADGTGARNLTNHPANDWGPDWSPDGKWIAFNSDRDGFPLRGYLVAPDGSGLRRIDTDAWFEYPSFSPDGRSIVFEGHAGADYDIYTVEIATGRTTRLTDAPGNDSWPVWSPNGSSIAFTTQRDDCLRAPRDQDCWISDGEPGEHHDVWIMNADGSNQRRVTPESGQFMAWSPDGQYILVSGRTLFAIRPDGTGRVEIRPPGMRQAPGGIPDWGA